MENGDWRFWCHECQKEFQTKQSLQSYIQCPLCKGEFCEQIEEDNNPQNFVPYQASNNTNNSQQQQQQQNQQETQQNGNSSTYVQRFNNGSVVISITNHNNLVFPHSNNFSSMMQSLFPVTFEQTQTQFSPFSQFMMPNENNIMQNIIQYIIDHDPNFYGNPPASEQSINNLKEIEITEEILNKYQECIICKEQFTIKENVILMPCNHAFHKECIHPWLKLHNSCPTCRYELPTDDKDYEKKKQTQMPNQQNQQH